MSQDRNHLNHATWECKYHVVFTPKYRKKLLFGQIRRHLGTVFHELARRKVRIPMKPAMHSNRKPATCSDAKPAAIPI